MIDLNNLEEIKKLDPKDVYGSTELFIKQCEQVLEEHFDLEVPSDYKNIKNIVFCGMGGSAYGGHVARALYQTELKVPLELVSDYHLPQYVNSDTLVILASYSGSTEEVLSCAKEALKKDAKITGVTSGGQLAKTLNSFPHILFNPTNNPSGQPRLGTGYMALSSLILLKSVGAITLARNELEQAIIELSSSQSKTKELAKTTAENLEDSIPVIFAAEHLSGNAHILRNQLNETSKSFSAFSELPELNHHLLEGFKNPENHGLRVLILNSDLYSEKIKRRIELTKDVVNKNKLDWIDNHALGTSPLSQVMQTLSFGGYLSLYLALLYGQDPSLIPWVNYFKENLK